MDYEKEINEFKKHYAEEDYVRFLTLIIERAGEMNKAGKKELVIQFDVDNPLNDINLFALFYNNFHEIAERLTKIGYKVEKNFRNGKSLTIRW